MWYDARDASVMGWVMFCMHACQFYAFCLIICNIANILGYVQWVKYYVLFNMILLMIPLPSHTHTLTHTLTRLQPAILPNASVSVPMTMERHLQQTNERLLVSHTVLWLYPQ